MADNAGFDIGNVFVQTFDEAQNPRPVRDRIGDGPGADRVPVIHIAAMPDLIAVHPWLPSRGLVKNAAASIKEAREDPGSLIVDYPFG